MAERKVIQKYYHPEFDPSQIPRRKVTATNQVKIRMMIPMTVQCSVCGEFMYQGKKFNSRKETVQGEEYLGLKVFRFYIRCTRCASEVTFKTDPKNSGYVPEHNCVRSFPPNHKHNDELNDHDDTDADAMKKLESKTMDSKQELEDLDVLDSIKTFKNLRNKISADHLLEKLHQEEKQEEQSRREEEFTQKELEEINDFHKQKRSVYLEDEDDEQQEADQMKATTTTTTTEQSTKQLNNITTNDNTTTTNQIEETKKRDSSFISEIGEVQVIKKKRKKATKKGSTSAIGSLSSYD